MGWSIKISISLAITPEYWKHVVPTVSLEHP